MRIFRTQHTNVQQGYSGYQYGYMLDIVIFPMNIQPVFPNMN